MSPRTGRPKTGNARESKTFARLSEDEAQRLDYCCKVLGLTKAEVIRRGIDRMYEEAQNKSE